MDYYSCYKKYILILGIIICVIIASNTNASDENEQVYGFEFTAHRDATYTISGRSIPLNLVLSKVEEQTNVKIYVDSSIKQRPVTINAKNINLVELLKRIAGDNYVMLFGKHNVKSLHILPKGQKTQAKISSPISDFSGQVKVSNNRAKMFFTPKNNSNSEIQHYIKNRHATLAKLSEQEPHKKLNAQLSFHGYLSSEQIIAIVNENNLDPVSLNIGWKENGGGYDLKEGETIETAIYSASKHHQRFVSQIEEDANMQVASLRQQGISDEEMNSELVFQKNANDLSKVFQNQGVLYYGLRVAASSKQLYSLTNDDQAIRLVDPMWGGLVEDEVSNTYQTMKIAIPLVPVDEIDNSKSKEDK